MLTRGTPVILNDVDCPEAMLVAVLERYDDKAGVWHARYLSPRTNMQKCCSSGSLGGPTPIDLFGVKLEIRGEEYRVVQSGASQAKYRDGKPREWQDRRGGDQWQKARKVALKLLSN